MKLISRDDGYEPTQSIAAMKQLIDENQIFGVVGAVGTPTSQAIAPIAAQAGLPFIGPFTGAEFLRDPSLGNVENVRASYFQETEMMVEHLTKDLKLTRIGILYQDDAFGRAGLAGVQKAMERRNMQLVSEGNFARNTVAVKMALLSIRKGDPEAVILIGPYKPCAEFIKLARQIKMNARGRGVLSRLAKLHRAILALASGDLEVNLPDKLALDRDELGDMARAVQIFRENAVEKARVEAQADCASRRNRSRRVGNRRRRQAASDSPAGGEHQCQPNGAHDSAKRCDGARDGRRRE